MCNAAVTGRALTTEAFNIEALQREARELLQAAACAALARVVRVQWNSRMRSAAGSAQFRGAIISLNPRLAQFGSAEIDRTLRHELAHLIAQFRAGRRRIAPHGGEWRKACAELGIRDEERCHNLPLPRRQVKRDHTYRCPNCRQEVHRARIFRRKVACLGCCRAHNAGRYHEKFKLEKIIQIACRRG